MNYMTIILIGLGLLGLVQIGISALIIYRMNFIILLQDRALRNLVKEFRMSSNTLAGVGRRLLGMERQFNDIAHQQIAIAEMTANAEQGQNAYLQANQLFAMGASIENVMKSCQLTRAEAELLAHIHNPNTIANTSDDDIEEVISDKI